jgi:hypothetical protein
MENKRRFYTHKLRQMNKNEISAGTNDEQRTSADDSTSASLEQNGMLAESPVRIQRSRQHKQVSPNGLPIVYVGRGSRWGNPFKLVLIKKQWHVVAKENEKWNVLLKTNSHDEALNFSLKSYQYWLMPYTHKDGDIEKFYQSTAVYESIVSELKGKNLACWCNLKEKCHADILLKLAIG